VTIVVQGSAIVLLPPPDYGLFALFSLVLGLGTTAVYSLLSEAWSKGSSSGQDWPSYSTMLVCISTSAAIPVLCIAVFTSSWDVVFGMIIAIPASIYRVGARYFSIASADRSAIALPDLIALVVLLVSVAVQLLWLHPMLALSCGWGLAAVAAALCSRPPRMIGGRMLGTWYREHWPHARVLVADSVLLESGSSLVPMTLTPFMGLEQFGVYRSISSAAVPVRLIINPLRPNIAGMTSGALLSARVVLLVAAMGAVSGTAVWLLLVLLRTQSYIQGSTLFALSGYALPAALYVGVNFISTFYSLALRTHVDGPALIVNRTVVLAFAIVVPIGGFFCFGLGGAVWGYVAVTSIALAAALLTLRRSRPRHDVSERS